MAWINIDRSTHHYHAHKGFAELEAKVAMLSKEVADCQAALNDAASRSVTTAKTFNDQLAALQAQLAAGTLSAEDKAALVAMAQIAAGIDPNSPVTLPPAPAPAPTPSTP